MLRRNAWYHCARGTCQVAHVPCTMPTTNDDGYVHNLFKRSIPPCGGSVPWTFLMSMVIVDMATRVYIMSGLKLALPNDIKLPDISHGYYTWAYTVGGDFPGINRVYWRWSCSPTFQRHRRKEDRHVLPHRHRRCAVWADHRSKECENAPSSRLTGRASTWLRCCQ